MDLVIVKGNIYTTLEICLSIFCKCDRNQRSSIFFCYVDKEQSNSALRTFLLCMMSRIMAPPKCLRPNSQNLWICYLHGKRDFAHTMKLKVLRWEDYSGLHGWAQWNHRGPHKLRGRQESQSKRRCDGNRGQIEWRRPWTPDCRRRLEA